MNQWLARDPKRAHKYKKDYDGTPLMGAPKCYVIEDLKNWRMEVMNWVFDSKTLKPSKVHDHLTGSCFRYILLCGPRYYGDDVMRKMRGDEGAKNLGTRNGGVDVEGAGRDTKSGDGRRYTGYSR